MCGIAGIFQNSVYNYSEVCKIINTINHRGPDAKGIWHNEFISIGSVRLKVVDFDENSNQPFVSRCKNYILAYNGEVYNYLNLKKKFNLKTKTDSDTEIIIELFSKIGPKAFSLLDGMFAISIYDIKNNKLYLARDCFGIKPLYYFKKNKKIVFCSEIKGILETEKNVETNHTSVINFIKWGGLDNSTKTWFKNIERLEPGSYCEINTSFKLKKVKYYKLEENLKKKKNLVKRYSLYF